MLLEKLLSDLKAALEERSGMRVYLSYDPTPLAQRPAQFAVLGMDCVETDRPFLTDTDLYYAFTAAVRVTLLSPPETNESEMYNTFFRGIQSGMLSSGFTMKSLRSGTPEEVRKLHKMTLFGTFTLSGLMQMRREEAGV